MLHRFQPTGWHYSADLQVHQDLQKCSDNDREEEDSKEALI